MLGWANVERHLAEEITLLCDRHHREKTGGLLPVAVVKEANETPFNTRSGETAPYTLWYEGTTYDFDIGTNRFLGDLPGDGISVDPVRLDGFPILRARLEDDHYLLNFQVLDSAGSKVAQVIDNELVMSSIAWDIELVGTRLIIREGHGRVLLDIQFTPPSSLRVRRARFLYNGIELLVTEEWAAVLNNSMLLSGNVCVGGRAGLAIGDDPEPVSAAIRMGGIRRHGWDRAEAIRWIKERVGSAVEAPLEEIYGFTDSQG